jgi:hypothetical protein
MKWDEIALCIFGVLIIAASLIEFMVYYDEKKENN